MQRLFTRTILFVCAVAMLSCAATKSTRTASAEPSGTIERDTVTVAATVVRVDAKRRLVTLQAPDGRRVTARVHTSVKALEQVKVGDTVRATYYESLAYDVKKPGASMPGVATTEAVSTVKRAGAVDVRTVTVTATIGAVDRNAGTLTLQAPDAEPLTVRVQYVSTLASVQPGDLMEITYSEAVAVALEGAQQSSPP